MFRLSGIPVLDVFGIFDMSRDTLAADVNFDGILGYFHIRFFACILVRAGITILAVGHMAINMHAPTIDPSRVLPNLIHDSADLKQRNNQKRPNYVRSTPEIVAENILNRNFTAQNLNEKWLTDVTEFKYGNGGKLYLSAILDLKDKSIVAFALGHSNNNKLVFETFDDAVRKYPDAKPLFHSDRGFQYTSKVFKAKLDTQGMTQSMSRVGCCIDNGPMEAFWGTLKAEMYYLQRFDCFDSLKIAIENYIIFYNGSRYQEKLGGLAPLEFRAVLLAA